MNNPGSMRRVRPTVSWICRRLERAEGAAPPRPRRAVLDELIGTILSQNTTSANSRAAMEELRRRFSDWEAVRRAPANSLAAAIRSAGLANRRAPRIRAILQRLERERGELSLEFLRRWPARRAMAYLQSLPGVGPKTAACVLLFACGKPVVPVDTHVHRVSRRLGLIGPKVTAEAAHDALARLVPPARAYAFHVLLVRHGRTVCRARAPRCRDCPLASKCPSAPERCGDRAAAR